MRKLERLVARWLAGRGYEVREIVRHEDGSPLASVRIWPDNRPITAADIDTERALRGVR